MSLYQAAPGAAVRGEAIARIRGKPLDGAIISVDDVPGGLQAIDAEGKAEFELLPCLNPEQRSVTLVVAPSGAGKSTVAAAMARTFIECFRRGKKAPVVAIVCPEDSHEDKAFKDVPHVHISPEAIETEGLELKDLVSTDGDVPERLVIFDDVEGLKGSAAAAVERLGEALLTRARKKRIFVIWLSHKGAEGRKTKHILSESNGIIWFPTAAYDKNFLYTLEHHIGIDPAIRSAIKKRAREFGRWIYLRRDGPVLYLVSPKKVCIYDPDELAVALKAVKITQRRAAEAAAAKSLGVIDKKPSARSQLRALAHQVRTQRSEPSEDDISETDEDY